MAAAAAYQVVLMAAARASGRSTTRALVKVYESFTGAKVAGPKGGDQAE